MSPQVEHSNLGRIALLRLARPDLRNAFTAEQVSELGRALDSVAADEAVRVVILTGTGRYFNVGGSRGKPEGVPADWQRSRDAHRQQFLAATQVIRQLHRMPKITVAAVNGGCAGAGLALALAADLRYAADTAKFNTAFLTNANPGELGAIWFATRLIGAARARELFLLPDKIDADTAARLGLVHRVVPANQLMSHVSDRAERIAAADPQAVAAMKANLNDAVTAGFDDYLDRETERMLTCQWSAPAATRRTALLEPPG